MSKESKLINNIKYSKLYKEEKFWTADELGVDPGVVCSCGNSQFSLSYGNYELIAHCTKCGLSECVYSG